MKWILSVLLLSCATTQHPRADTVDVRDAEGRRVSLHSGEVWVVDACAQWSDVCLVNARVMDEVCKLRCGPGVRVATIVLDDMSAPAVRALREVFHVSQELLIPGETTRQGLSALGSMTDIPAVWIIDQEGQVVEETRGGVLSAQGIIKRIDALR